MLLIKKKDFSRKHTKKKNCGLTAAGRARQNRLRVKRSPLFLSLLSTIFLVSPCPILDLRACHRLFLKPEFDGKKSSEKRKF